MTKYYSASENAFFDTAFAKYTLPHDAIEITDDEHKAIFEQQRLGKKIVPGQDGKPTTQEYPKATYDVLRKFEYPSIGDQLDALYHAGAFPADMAAKIKTVKDKYPKV